VRRWACLQYPRPPTQIAAIAATVHAQQLRPQGTAAATLSASPPFYEHILSSRKSSIPSQGTEEEEAKANAKERKGFFFVPSEECGAG
jgi:hypothetical protein